MNMRLFIVIFILLISLVQFSIGQDFEVSPAKLAFNAEPGESQEKMINVKNHSSKKMPILVSVGDFLPSTRGGKKYLEAKSTKYSIANWMSISPAYFELNPNEERQISVTLQAPLDDYSSKWGMIYFTSAREQEAFGADKGITAGMNISARIAVQVTQSPASNTNYVVKISRLREVTTEGDRLRKFQANIDNIGDKIAKCKVYLIASNLETAEETKFDEIKFTSYSKSTKIIELSLPDELPNGKYSLAAILDYGSSSSLEGTQLIIEVPHKNQ